MATILLDDKLLSSPTVVSMSRGAKAMHVAGLFHISANKTDGYIRKEHVRNIAGDAGVRYFKIAVSELTRDGIWSPDDAGYDVLGWGVVAKRESERLPAHEWIPLRSFVFERDNFTCTYCGERGGRLECDHIIPVSRGGGSNLDNLTTSCFTCNRSKRDKTVEEWLDVEATL